MRCMASDTNNASYGTYIADSNATMTLCVRSFELRNWTLLLAAAGRGLLGRGHDPSQLSLVLEVSVLDVVDQPRNNIQKGG